MTNLFRLSGAVAHDPQAEAWFFDRPDSLRLMTLPWFNRLMSCGEGLGMVLHDGAPTVCLGDAAFAYVNAFRSHAAIGFFRGAHLPDPDALLQGQGRSMRHVKLRLGHPQDEAAVNRLIAAAYADIRMALNIPEEIRPAPR